MKPIQIFTISLILISLLISCKDNKLVPAEKITFKELTGFVKNDITRIEFRDGGTGTLYRTTDSEKIKEFWTYMNNYTYRKTKQPEPFAGFLYGGNITNLNEEVRIGFAMGMMSVKETYYKINTENEKEFFNNLTRIVESFGKVPSTNGNTP